MKIGIDIDEVIVEFLEGYIQHYNSKNSSSFALKDFHSYQFWEVLPISKEEAIRIAEEFFESELFDNISFVKNAKENLKGLIKKNNIFFITARPTSWRNKTQKFFENHLPNEKYELIFSSDFHSGSGSKKSDVCLSFEIPIIIEDNKHYALDCAEKGIKVLLLDKPWNKGITHKNIIRVFSWGEIISELNKFKRET
jgi:uncharacterized HAD superfamily protein